MKEPIPFPNLLPDFARSTSNHRFLSDRSIHRTGDVGPDRSVLRLFHQLRRHSAIPKVPLVLELREVRFRGHHDLRVRLQSGEAQVFRLLLPLQESDEVPRTDVYGECGLLGGRRRSTRLPARPPCGRLLRAETQATIPALISGSGPEQTINRDHCRNATIATRLKLRLRCLVVLS